MWIFGAFMSVFYAVGIGLLSYALVSWKRSSDVGAWPTCTGQLEQCELKNDHSGEGESYRVVVAYKYTVKGQEYTGDVLAFGYGASSGEKAHREILDKLQAAKSVQVYYNPHDPKQSALSYGMHRGIKLTLAFAITWLAFCIGFSLVFWVAASSDTVLLQNLVTK